MRIRNKLLVALCAIFCASCATPMSPKAAAIQVHNQMSTLLTNCKNLGPVDSVVPGGGEDFFEATVKAREQVADKGGDTLVVVNKETWREATGSIPLFVFKARVQGAALRCY